MQLSQRKFKGTSLKMNSCRFCLRSWPIDTARTEQNGCHVADDTFHLNFTEVFHEVLIDNKLALVQTMAWCRTGEKSFTGAMEIHFMGTNITLRQRQNGRHFPDDIFKCIFLNEKDWISNTIWLKFVNKGPINNNTALVQIMACCRTGDKPSSEPVMA